MQAVTMVGERVWVRAVAGDAALAARVLTVEGDDGSVFVVLFDQRDAAVRECECDGCAAPYSTGCVYGRGVAEVSDDRVTVADPDVRYVAGLRAIVDCWDLHGCVTVEAVDTVRSALGDAPPVAAAALRLVLTAWERGDGPSALDVEAVRTALDVFAVQRVALGRDVCALAQHVFFALDGYSEAVLDERDRMTVEPLRGEAVGVGVRVTLNGRAFDVLVCPTKVGG